MKQKMSTADVAAEVACLRARVLNMRVMNVYDINTKVCFFLIACQPRVAVGVRPRGEGAPEQL